MALGEKIKAKLQHQLPPRAGGDVFDCLVIKHQSGSFNIYGNHIDWMSVLVMHTGCGCVTSLLTFFRNNNCFCR